MFKRILVFVLFITSVFFQAHASQSEGTIILTVLTDRAMPEKILKFASLKYRCEYIYNRSKSSCRVALPKNSKRISILSNEYRELKFMDDKTAIMFYFNDKNTRKVSFTFHAPANMLVDLEGIFDIKIRCPEELMIRQFTPVNKNERFHEYIFKKASVLNVVIERNTKRDNFILLLFCCIIFLLFAGLSVKKKSF